LGGDIRPRALCGQPAETVATTEPCSKCP
jgi:hypothetical protein